MSISIIDAATAPPPSSARGSAPAAADARDLEAAKAEVSGIAVGREPPERGARGRRRAIKHISIIGRCSTCATAPPLSSARGSAPAAADSSDLEAAKAEVSSGSRAPPPCRSNVCTHRQARERLDLAWSARHARASRSRASPHARMLCARAAPSPMPWFSDRGLLFEATFLAATTTP